MKTLCNNIELDDDMFVIFRDDKVTLKYAIANCKPGEPIEGIHPFQYDKLQRIFETNRGKKFQYSVDIRYGDWRFILFDVDPVGKYEVLYSNPKYFDSEIKGESSVISVKPIQL